MHWRVGQSFLGRRLLSSSATFRKAVPVDAHGASQAASSSNPLRLIMFGKPGAGKGTLSARLVKKYQVEFISAGDLLRQNIAKKTRIGQIAEKTVADGGLLPDPIITEIITNELFALDDRPWILDGFPRTVGQGELLDAHLRKVNRPLNLIVNLEVPSGVILDRIKDRWVHLPSGRVYNLSYNRPKKEGLDDETGEALSKRPDDTPEVFSRRLKKYYDATEPLLSYFSSRSTANLVTLRGSTSDQIWPQLEDLVITHFTLRTRHTEANMTHDAEESRDSSLLQAR